MNTEYIDKNRNSIVAVLVGALTILIVLMISFIFNFNLVENLVLGWIFTTIFAVFAFFLINDKIVIQEKVKYVDRPFEVEKIKEVIREVPVAYQIPIENKTIEVVDRPVFRDVVREVPVRFEVERPRTKNLNIPKWEYVASSQERRYHKRKCRFGKLIKNKFKVHSHSQAFFKRKKYKACKMCIKRK